MDETERTSIRRTSAEEPRGEPMLHVLQVEDDSVAPARRAILGEIPLRIGRVEGNDLVLASSEVSRHHCSLVLQDGRAMVTDLGSTNGTLVDGRRIEGPTPLGHGTRLRVGPFSLTYLTGPRRALERAAEIERDLDRAARYVRALLPPAMVEGPVRADWRFVPSVSVGGDGFGYRTLPDGRFVFWLLDVMGHGLGSALLAATVMTLLREGGPPGTDPGDGAAVLGALDAIFPMERHGGLFFTVWYGAYDPATRALHHAAAGHHAAFLVEGGALRPVGTRNLPIGAGLSLGRPDAGAVPVPPGARLHLFSDGTFETLTPGGKQNGLSDFLPFVAAPPMPGVAEPDRILRAAQQMAGGAPFDDDVSILVLDFP
ncbi:PP2C family protein-serine/threonine phosphatase [Falsiroseomonas sp. HW251]|uniref:PP2C family protein-serine/threonine phosphatase n=1 Tax=Falsiroseomonas sp. HW251 TaxID=3390998 RepID=UPI003D3144FC